MLNKIKLNIVSIGAVFTLLTFGNSFAQNFNDVVRLSENGLGSDARALAMGNAFDAVADNYAAVFFNPAGLAQIRYMETSLGVDYSTFGTTTNFLGNSSQSSKGKFSFNQIGFVFPVPTNRGSFAFSLGYNRKKNFENRTIFNGFNSSSSLIQFLTYSNDDIPYNLGLSYPIYNSNDEYLYDETIIDGRLQQSGSIEEEGYLDNWSFGLAFEAAKGFFIGATFNYISGKYASTRSHKEDDINNYYDYSTFTDPRDSLTADFQTFYLTDILTLDIGGWEFKGGILFKPNERLRISGTVKFPTIYTVHDNLQIDAESQFGTGVTYYLDPGYYDRIKYDIRTPFEITGGVSYKERFLLFSGQIQYVDYKNARFNYGLDPYEMSEKNAVIFETLRGVLNFHMGFEMLIPRMQLKLRTGFIYQTSPYKDDPTDYDKKYITAGLGLGFSKTTELNLAYVYGWSQNFGDLYGADDARYYTNNDVHKFVLTMNFRY